MTVFDMITSPPDHLKPLADAINNKYFTIDTADLITVHQWIDFNPTIVTYALSSNEVVGFFNIIPLTTECGALFEKQAIKEEDLSIEHILPQEARRFAQYAYLAAVAIADTTRYRDRQCAAALMATMADHFLNAYNLNYLKRIFVNPTTFDGNSLVRKLGMRPIVAHKKPLKGNDIYTLEITPETVDSLQAASKRYGRFIGDNPWRA